ncbi:hypothetical protein MHYP_G00320690 [Metynnis hypsauchen]
MRAELESLIKCLKKALEPALTDVRIDWYVPDNMEALLSPNEIPLLYPGNRLIGYCTFYDVSAFKVKKNEVKSNGYRPAPRGSVGSVFELSPGSSELLQPLVPASEREAAEEGEIEDALREISREISSEFSCAPATDNTSNSATDQDYIVSDVHWRMEQASYVQEQYMLTRCSLGIERGLASFSSPSEGLSLGMDTGSLPQGLERVQPQGRGLSCWESPWQQNTTSSADTESEKSRHIILLFTSGDSQRSCLACSRGPGKRRSSGRGGAVKPTRRAPGGSHSLLRASETPEARRPTTFAPKPFLAEPEPVAAHYRGRKWARRRPPVRRECGNIPEVGRLGAFSAVLPTKGKKMGGPHGSVT